MANEVSVVSEITTTEGFSKAFPIMNQLRTDLTLGTYLELLEEMRNDGYLLFGLFVEDDIVAVTGVSIRVNFYNRRHVFVYDLVTSEQHRSKGYGEELLAYIHSWSKENDAEYVALESGIQRTDAHRFYEERLDYDKWCYSFRKEL